MSDTKVFYKVINNSILFSIGTVATKAISFFMLPVYTFFMSETEYGMASTLLSFIQVFSLLVLLGMRAAILRFYPNIQSKEEKKQFVGNIFIAVLVNGILIVTLASLLKHYWTSVLFSDIDFYPLIICALLALIPEAMYYAYQSFLQAEQDGYNYTRNSIIYMLLYASLNIFFIVCLRLNTLGMLLSMILSPTIMTVYGIFSMTRNNTIKFILDNKILGRILKYSIPVVPHDLSAMSVTLISKIFLNNSVSFAATGLFTVASQISTAMSLVQTSMNLAFHPWFNQQMKEGLEGRIHIRSFSVFIFAFYCYVSIIISFFSPEILSIITPPAYHTAWKFVPFLVMALVISFIYYSHVLSIFYNVKASKFIMLCSLSGAVLNIVLLDIFVNKYAAWGAVFAYFISRVATAIIAVVYSRIVQPVDFGLTKMCLLTIATAVMILSGLSYGWIYEINGVDMFNICIKLAILSIISVLVVYTKRKIIFDYTNMLLSKRSLRRGI